MDEKPEEPETETRITALEASMARVQADYANYRRRTEEQREQERARAAQALAQDLLGVVDHLERAREQATTDATDLCAGIQLIHEELLRVLEEHGVQRIQTETFDPLRHEVVQRSAHEAAKGTIVEVLRHGYEMGGVVLRAAQVAISTGPQEEHS